MLKLEKYFPIVANIHLLAIHLFWRWFALDIRDYTAVFFGFSFFPWLIIYGYSKRHYFCTWHRVLLANLLLHGVFYSVNNYLFSHGYTILPIFYVTLWLTILTLLIATALYFKDGCFKTDKKSLLRSWKGYGLRSMESVERQRAGGLDKTFD
jgi:hypothetical protein